MERVGCGHGKGFRSLQKTESAYDAILGVDAENGMVRIRTTVAPDKEPLGICPSEENLIDNFRLRSLFGFPVGGGLRPWRRLGGTLSRRCRGRGL